MISFNFNNYLELVKLDEATLLNIVFESPTFFRSFLNKLVNQVEAGEGNIKVYLENNEKILGKIASIVENPLFLKIDDKKINSWIQKDIYSSLTEEQKNRFDLLILSINEWLQSIVLSSNLKIDFDHNVSFLNFLKTFNLCSKVSGDNDVVIFINKLKSISFTFGIKVFFIINLHDFYSIEEIDIIFRELLIHDIHLIVVSNKKPNNFCDFERFIVVDDDLAEMHHNFK